ncbi:MAG: oligosaccharide flippase family protein [Bacteroidota bacterium]
MNRKFLTNLALLILLNLLIKPFWIFGIEVSVQNTVGAENYGFYFTLFNFSLILNILLDLGITNFNNRNISQNNHLLSKHFSSLIVLKFLFAISYGIISIAVAFLIGWGWSEMKLLLILIFNQILSSFILYFRSNISGLQFFRIDSMISVLDRFLMILICGLLLWGNITKQTFQIEWFVYAQTVAYGITFIIAFFIVYTKCDFLKLNYDRTFFFAILKKSLPFALLILLMTFYNRVDPIMLERLLPDGQLQAGIYAQGYRILDAANNFAFLFPTLLLPMFSKMLKNKESVNQLLKLSFLLLIVPAMTLSIGCLFYSYDIMNLFYQEHAEVSAPIFMYIMIGFVSISSTHIFGTLLTANGNLKLLNLVSGSGMVVNIVLNIILIPIFGAKGAAITSLCTQTFTALVQILIARKIFNLSINYKLLFSFLGFVLILLLTGYVTTRYIDNWLIGISIYISISILFAISVRLISIRNLINIIVSNKD